MLHIAGGCVIYYGSQTESELIEDKPNLAIELYMDEVAPVDPDTVGQFTGLCDREGKEIFEGDIVKNESAGFYGFVKYNDAAFIIYLGEMNGVLLICLQTCAMKVIGNIYDNPKLLKGGQK